MICLLVMGRSFMKWLEKLRWHSSLYTNAMVCLRASTMSLRADKMSPEGRYDLMEEVADVYREKLGMEREEISGENFVRDLTAVLFATRAA